MGASLSGSVELLSEGHSIVLCPDVDYQSKSAFMGETYAGFAGIAGMTRSHSGVDVAFIPVHCSKEEKTIYTGAPIYCAEGRAEEGLTLAVRVRVAPGLSTT